MKYLILTEYFPASETAEITGGVESRYLNIIRELSRNNQVIVICSRQPGEPRESTVFGAKVLKVGPIIPYSNNKNILGRIKFFLAAYSQAKKIKGTQVIEAGSFLTYLPTYFAGKKIKAHKVATWHETWVGEWIKNKGWITGMLGEIWERIALRLNWDKIIPVSDFTKDRLIKYNIKCKNLKVVPNGIDIEEIKRIRSKKYVFPTVVFFGRLSPTKNVDLLIKSIDIVKRKIPNIRLNILGGGPEENNLRELVKRLGLNNHVNFFGSYEDHAEMLKEAKKAHLFVSPSTVEGFGITVIEAMALGLPYVISDIPPFKEITENGKGGYIFPSKNYKELAENMITLLNNYKLRIKKVEEGKNIIKKYLWKNIIKQYI